MKHCLQSAFAQLRRTTLAVVLLVASQWLIVEWLAERYCWSTWLCYLPQHLTGVFLLIVFFRALRINDIPVMVVAATASLFWLFGPMGLRVHSPRIPSTQGLRVLTWNVHHAPQGLEPIVSVVRGECIDVACFMEANELPGPDRRMATYGLPLGWRSVKADDVVIWSRWPITRWRAWRITAARRSILEADIRTPQGMLTVYSVHFATRWPVDLPSTRFNSTRCQSAGLARLKQSALLALLASARPGHRIVCGDLNMPPRGLAYRRLCSDLQDAFDCAGSGFGYTWPSRVPIMRIDYIWASRDLRVTSCRTLHTRASDHRPVVASLQPAQ